MPLNYVSSARISPYKKHCKTDAEAIELHNECMLIGSALLSVISMIEIALRNRVHTQIAKDFGRQDWLTINPSPVPLGSSETSAISQAVRQAQQDKYSKLSNSDKLKLNAVAYPHGVPPNITHKRLSKKRQEKISVTEGEVVAHTTLFFWKRFFAPEYEPTLWDRSVKRTFPNKTLGRSDVSAQIEIIYRARNRLAHHEPMYGLRLRQAVSAVDFVRLNFDSKFPDQNGPLCIFTQFQHDNLMAKLHHFESRWKEITGSESN